MQILDRSIDGKSHTLIKNTNRSSYGRAFISYDCKQCKWTSGSMNETSTGNMTSARVREWNDHIRWYEELLRLTPVPKPVWMGSWVSQRKEGNFWIYHWNDKLPRGTQHWYGKKLFKDYIDEALEFATGIGQREWRGHWLAFAPLVVIESHKFKNKDVWDYTVRGLAADLSQAQLTVNKNLSTRERNGERVERAEQDWPIGLEAPMPAVEAFVENLVKISQTNDYGEILEALREVRRGIIQLELLQELEAQLESKLMLDANTSTV